MAKVLVVGIPRSGTTWVAMALSKCRDVIFYNEPDDERRNAFARTAKEGLGRYPIIAPYDRGRVGETNIGAYTTLWKTLYEDSILAPNIVVKSVFVPYCLEWVAEMCKATHVVWVDRLPLNTLASWLEYSKKVNTHISADQLIRRLAWQYSMQRQAYERLSQVGMFHAHIQHEYLAGQPDDWPVIAEMAGLEWTHEAAELINDLAHEGEGGHPGLPGYNEKDHTSRTAEQVRVDAWTHRIDQYEAEAFEYELRRWGFAGNGGVFTRA